MYFAACTKSAPLRTALWQPIDVHLAIRKDQGVIAAGRVLLDGQSSYPLGNIQETMENHNF